MTRESVRLGLPRGEPGVGRLWRHALADEAVAGGGAAGHVDALRGLSIRTRSRALEPPPFPLKPDRWPDPCPVAVRARSKVSCRVEQGRSGFADCEALRHDDIFGLDGDDRFRIVGRIAMPLSKAQ